MKIRYHREKCMGCGICAASASHIWDLSNDDGKADLMDSESKKDIFFRLLWPDETQVVHEIISACPTKAITLI